MIKESLEKELNTHGFEVTKSVVLKDRINIKATYSPKDYVCPYCSSNELSDFGWASESLAVPPIEDTFVKLTVKKRRFKCNNCGQTSSAATPFKYKKRQVTNNLAVMIAHLAVDKSFNEVAQVVGLTKTSVRAIFNEYWEEERDKVLNQDRFKTPKVLGIEAINDYILLSNVEKGTIIDVFKFVDEQNLTSTLSTYFNVEDVETVVVGRISSHASVAQTVFKNALVVTAKFHWAEAFNSMMDLCFGFSLTQVDKRQMPKLKASQAVLKLNRQDIKENAENEAKLEYIRIHLDDLYSLYQIKEDLLDLWGEKEHSVKSLTKNCKDIIKRSSDIESICEVVFMGFLDGKCDKIVASSRFESSQNTEQNQLYADIVSWANDKVDSLDLSSSDIAVWANLTSYFEATEFGFLYDPSKINNN